MIDHEIRKSLIHGLGVFALEPAKEGTLIWEFNPLIDVRIAESDLASLPAHVVRNIQTRSEYFPDQGIYVISLDGDAFMNHSDNPNLTNHGSTATAARDILIGDELTCDYRETKVVAFDPDNPSIANMKAGE